MFCPSKHEAMLLHSDPESGNFRVEVGQVEAPPSARPVKNFSDFLRASAAARRIFQSHCQSSIELIISDHQSNTTPPKQSNHLNDEALVSPRNSHRPRRCRRSHSRLPAWRMCSLRRQQSSLLHFARHAPSPISHDALVHGTSLATIDVLRDRTNE